MKEFVATEMQLNEDGVWVRPDAVPFPYSDGLETERYLESAFLSSSDLSSGSVELELRARDWPSEYHLTRRRAQLLRGFDFDPSARVLEVGCGCGAITRLLGESFDQVVSVEGSLNRARLARMRTRGMQNVSIVCSPLEKVDFHAQFDIVFCIGVLEYAGVYAGADQPYQATLDRFAGLLNPDGMLVLAIENQFGLKYWASSAEDHTGVMFDGIQGYVSRPGGPRTFGRTELEERLRKRFRTIEFYYPVPDYKIPLCVISEEMTEKIDIAPLLGSYRNKDYGNPGRKRLFSEELVWGELTRNRIVPWFANSFLVLAGKGDRLRASREWLAIAYSKGRRKEFSAVTRFIESDGGKVLAVKSREDGSAAFREEPLEHRAWQGEWIDGESLQSRVARRARSARFDLAEIFAPARPWFDSLKSAVTEADGRKWVEGSLLDSIWRNCYVRDGECKYIDQEWAWTDRLSLELAISRGLLYFVQDLLRSPGLSPALQGSRVWKVIATVAGQNGVELTWRDAWRLARLESEFLLRSSVGPTVSDRRRFWAALDVLLVLGGRLDRGQRTPRLRSLARRGLRRLKRILGRRR